MNFFERKSVWQNWQLNILKSTTVSMGILIGFYFSKYLKQVEPLFWMIFVIGAIWSTITWFKQMK